MNALDLLKEHHDEVKDLFEKYEKLGDRAVKAKRQCFVDIADRLSAHASIEEQIFYPAVKAKQTEDILLESLEEHLSAKRVIADLLDLDVEHETYDAKVRVLKELVEHHVKEEEGALFKKVKALFGQEELEMMGDTMKALYDDMLENEPRQEVPAMTDSAAPLS